jgi:hypothetical protein
MDIRTLHREALQIAKNANAALERGDNDEFLKLSNEALELEKKAANLVYGSRESEPTRSVLYRSAATLAYNCGKYDEAQYLIYCGLSGSPYPEIRTELESLLESIREIVKLQISPEQAAENLYIEHLRAKAVNLKLESKAPKHSKAIYTDYIVDFLKTINQSYLNYAKVNFKKSFINVDSDNADEMFNSFAKESKPLCVNLGFSSFGVSIIPDNETMFNSEFYSPKFNTWKNEIFDNYKSEVILPDYNSQEFLNSIQEKYSDEERIQIYSPIINSTKDTSPYKISLTDSTFKRTIKVYNPPQSTSKSILIPPPKPSISLPIETRVIVKRTDLVNISGKGKTKNLELEMMEVAEFKWSCKDFSSDNKTINLNEEYSLKILFDHGTFRIEDLYLNLYCSAGDMDLIKERYSKAIIDLYELLLIKDSMSVDELALLDKLNLLVYTRNWE